MTKSNFEKKGYLSAYNFQHTTKSLRGVIAVTQGRNLETGIEVVASCLLPQGCQPVLYIPQDHLFRGSIILIGLGLLHQSLIKKMSPRLVCGPVFGKCLSVYLLRPSFCTLAIQELAQTGFELTELSCFHLLQQILPPCNGPIQLAIFLIDPCLCQINNNNSNKTRQHTMKGY